MEKKGPQALAETELNAAVYYLQESYLHNGRNSVGFLSSSENLEDLSLEKERIREVKSGRFVHTAFNFFYEAGIGKGNIHGMIPQGALIRIVQKGLQYIELEANSEIGSDDEHHFFESLDLMTNDLDDLIKKITSTEKHNSVKNDKEQKIDSVDTDKGLKIGCLDTTPMYRKQSMREMKAAQNRNPDKTAKMHRAQPKKTGFVETTKGLGWQLSWIGRKPRLIRKRKHRKLDK